MNKSFKTEGIILKRKDFGEADRILTVFTLHRGKVTVIAKGVRRITSRRSGNVELLNRAVIFLHQGKNWLILTEASSLETYEKIKTELTLTTYAYHIIELIDKLMPEHVPDPWVYENLLHVLGSLNVSGRQIYIRAFEAKLLDHLGFVNFEDLKTSYLQEISEATRNLIIKLPILSWQQIEKLEIDSKTAQELENVLHYHLEKVIEGTLKSHKFLNRPSY